MTLIRGVQIASYEIVKSIGRGGRGEVYLSKDLKLDRDVAIKLLPEELAADPDRLDRFERESRAASALDHPNIITVHDIGVHNSRPYIVTEYLEGQTLREALSDGTPLNGKRLELMASVARGLARAHSADIIHQSLKPENVMLTEDGLAKILDFGLAALMTETGDEEAGTSVNEYMSPEQATGREVDYHSDQFSFGTILYETATGEQPFRCETAQKTLAAIVEDEPKAITEINPEVPARLPRIVERCLSKNPDDRYGSTRALARDLARVETGAGAFSRLIAMLRRRFKRDNGASN